MKKYNKSKDMFAAIRKDLAEETFPHLLHSLNTAVTSQLYADLSGVVDVGLGGRSLPPELYKFVSLVPPPGHAIVSTRFTSADEPSSGEYNHERAAAIMDVFEKFAENHLSSKDKLLKLLDSVGVS